MNEEKEYFNQRIECDVRNCKFLNLEQRHCTLGKIKVSSDKIRQTCCDSFENKEENE